MVVAAVVMVAAIQKIFDFAWARFGAAVFSMCRHVWEVAYSTSCGPTRSGLEPVIQKIIDFMWARLGAAVFPMCRHVWDVATRQHQNGSPRWKK